MGEAGDARWSPELLAKMVQWLEDAYPCEGCGLVVETDGEGWEFRACDNVIDKYHELDPETYPRTSRDFYMIDPRAFMKAEDRGEDVVVIVHSHPDAGDYFSDADVEAALMPRPGAEDPVEPLYPGSDYLVVSIRDGKAQSASLYRFDEATREFEKVEGLDAQVLREGISDTERCEVSA